MQNQHKLTMQGIKDCIALEGRPKKILKNMCDCWYKITIKDGKNEQAALNETLDNLGKTLLKMSE